jgi:hypothetical protein
MAKFLPYGGVVFPSQGSNEILELVKHFESNLGFDELQDQINLWLVFINSDVILNRPAIRSITFAVFEKSNPGAEMRYFAQVHYILVGDADDSPSV